MKQGILEDSAEMPGDPTTPDNTPQHEGAEPPEMEKAEGSEEDGAQGGYDDAMKVVMDKLYNEDIAKGIATAITQAPDKVKAIEEQASVLLGVADDVTQGSVPDELYISFAMDLLGEVIEIAQAAGVQVAGRDMAVIAREFIANTVEGLGGDVSQVREAMGQISPDDLGAQMEGANG